MAIRLKISQIMYNLILILEVLLNLILMTEAVISDEDLNFDVGILGKIKGAARTTVESGRDFVAFNGIPYARVEENGGRFLPARDIKPPLGDGNFLANGSMACCIQPSFGPTCEGLQTENCLQLHISTPLIQSEMDVLLPVVVFIHGGAFTTGTGGIYDGSRLLERDIVFVSVNYRLGLFGFFCLNTQDTAGNMGMYDLLQALKWIQAYISYFGGDPKLVTITGQSAGSVAVTSLMASPLASGLFHGAISLAGSSLNAWGSRSSMESEKVSLDVAAIVGCYKKSRRRQSNRRLTVKEAANVTQCMHEATASQLAEALFTYQIEQGASGTLGYETWIPVMPTVQSVAPPLRAKFLSENPLKIFETGRQANVPLLMDSARHEGSTPFALFYLTYMAQSGLENNETWVKTQLVPMSLEALGLKDDSGAVYDALAKLYVGKEAMASGNFTRMIPGILDLNSVFFIKGGAYKTLRLHSRLNTNSYWSSFDFMGENTYFDATFNPATMPVPGGVTHGDHLFYLFNLGDLTRDDEKAVNRRVVDYWTNFAYSGNPNAGKSHKAPIHWPPFSEANPFFLKINTDDEVVQDFPNYHWKGLSDELMP